MKGLQYIPALSIVLLAFCSAQADISAPPPGVTQAAQAAPQLPAPRPDAATQARGAIDTALGAPTFGLFSPLSQDKADGGQVRELPPEPSSVGLFLSAFGTLGAWRLTRLAKNIHLSNLPSWYHEGAPQQLGHTFACDLDFASLPACDLDQPAGQPLHLTFIRPQPDTLITPQFLLSTEPARGPPTLSF